MSEAHEHQLTALPGVGSARGRLSSSFRCDQIHNNQCWCTSDHLRLMAMIEMDFDLFIFKLNVTDGPAAEHNVAVPLSEPDQASRL
jgi:hypothetical protein